MSNIWHKLPEQPERGRDVIEKWHYLGIHYTHFVAKNGIAEDNPFTDAWCYLDDLLALETELERTRKALGIAVDAVKEIDKTRSVANHKIGTQDKTLNSGIMFCWTTPDQIHNTLTEIKTALEQKEHFADTSKKIEQKE